MTAEAGQEVLTQVRAALEREPRVKFHRYPVMIKRDKDGALILEGETENIAAKKVALEVAASTPGVTGIVDRLRVRPARRMGDGEVRDHVRDALLEEPAFENCAIRTRSDGRTQVVREPATGASGGLIEVAVDEGAVTLDGNVRSLSHKSLAGALACWVPGTRDVINAIEVAAPQDVTDSEITEAVHLVLEKDPPGQRRRDPRHHPQFSRGPGRILSQPRRAGNGRDGRLVRLRGRPGDQPAGSPAVALSQLRGEAGAHQIDEVVAVKALPGAVR